tara:strand:- start:1852 stop:2133 length:282 start_codon:yes stop_codon:yes gene_type:complete
MHRWYVKARYQEDHEERAAYLKCDLVLEDTSSQVNPDDALPHVIIQVGRLQKVVNPEDNSYINENIIFVEPVSLQELDAVPADDPYPDDPDEE